MFDIDLRPMFSIKWLKILILTVMVMVRVQYCVVKHGFWIQRATPSYFSAFVGRRVCRLLGWSPCRLVGWLAALSAAQKAKRRGVLRQARRGAAFRHSLQRWKLNRREDGRLDRLSSCCAASKSSDRGLGQTCRADGDRRAQDRG